MGYFSANSQITEAIATRTSELSKAEQSVSSPASFAATPNETYEVGLREYADQLEALNLEAQKSLWVEQLKDMTWPPLIADRMEKKGLRGYRAIEKEEKRPSANASSKVRRGVSGSG